MPDVILYIGEISEFCTQLGVCVCVRVRVSVTKEWNLESDVPTGAMFTWGLGILEGVKLYSLGIDPSTRKSDISNTNTSLIKSQKTCFPALVYPPIRCNS